MAGGNLRQEEWIHPETLRRYRIESGLSRAEAAEKVGISLEFWNKIEQGTRRPGQRTAVKIFELFNITVRRDSLVVHGSYSIEIKCGAPAPLVANGAMFVGCDRESEHEGNHSVTIRWAR